MPNRLATTNTTFSDPEFGTFALLRAAGYRRLSLRVTPSGMRLTAPRLVSDAQIGLFIDSHRPWIRKQLHKVSQVKMAQTILNPGDVIQTRFHTLTMLADMTDAPYLSIRQKQATLTVPFYMNADESVIRQAIRQALLTIWRREARHFLPDRIAFLASQYQFQYGKVTLRHTISRWGSCTAKNDLNFSIQIMRLPDHLTDYLILHELCHTRQKNHQAAFWQLLESVCPGAKKLDKELNAYRLDVF